MGMKALVTGGAGFMGSHLIDDLLELGYEVVCLDDLSGGYREYVSNAAEFIEGNIVDTELVDRLFSKHHFDYVYHLAAYAAEGLSHFIRRFNYTTNLIGTINLINASVRHEVKCFVFTSSIAVYGTNQLPMTEDLMPIPEDPYGISKLAVELDLLAAHRMFDLNYIIFRPHNVYGERQNIADRYRNVVGIFMNQLLKGEPMTIYGNGQQTRAFSYVKDVTPVIAYSVDNEKAYNQIFNIGADDTYTINELAKLVAGSMNLSPDIVHLPARNEVLHAYSSHNKAKQYLAFFPHVSISQGLDNMAEWVRRVGARRTPYFHHIEISKNHPQYWLPD